VLEKIRIVICRLTDSVNEPVFSNNISGMILSLSPDDISLLEMVKTEIETYMNRSYVYTGSEFPAKHSRTFLSSIRRKLNNDLLTERQYERILYLLVEKRLPAEVVIVLGGDDELFHTHRMSSLRKIRYQLESYLIPTGYRVEFVLLYGDKKENVIVKGPACVIFSDIPHYRKKGVCFVTKYPSGRYKQEVTDSK
jgi:hypothetical protein